jgi:hypothetical protein
MWVTSFPVVWFCFVRQWSVCDVVGFAHYFASCPRAVRQRPARSQILRLAGGRAGALDLRVAAPEAYGLRQIVKNQETFFRWEYGGALIFDGLWETAQHFPSIDYTPLLDSTLGA